MHAVGAACAAVDEIASALQVSPRTVETHKYEIMRVLGFKNTADLVRYATWLGLVNT